MRVPGSLTISAAERLLIEIQGERTDRTLTLATNARHLVAGGEAAFVQSLVTWAQNQHRATIKTYAGDSSDPQLGHFSRQLFGMSASLLCDRALASGDADVTEHLKALAIERLDSLQTLHHEASRGAQYEIVCADHLSRSAPKQVYDVSPDGSVTLKRRPAFLDVSKRIVRTIVPDNYLVDLHPDFTGSLGDALYELFKNTEEHARLDENGNFADKSLRVIQARRHSITPSNLENIVSDSPPLARYVKQISPPRKWTEHVQLAEISVLDSGPGFAPRWRGRPLNEITPHDEAEAVRECFDKHATVKTGSGAGLGLSNVMSILRERGGFFRIRTGRQSMYVSAFDAEEGPAGLKNWKANGAALPAVAGTLVTFLMPIVER